MAAPQIQRAVLVIADIGGYTRFMKLTRMNLAHAQQVVADLLVAVIDAALPLKLAKLEGDAALLWAPMSNDPKELRELSAAVLRIRSAFLGRRTQMVVDNTCTCESCQQIENLKIKFVAHEGEVALQKVKRNVELAGVDVILVHRMLKNNVPVNEYVLMTDQVRTALPDDLKSMTQTLAHDFEGLGEVETHFVDLTKVPLPPSPEPRQGVFRRLWRTLSVNAAALPEIIGISKPLVGYERTRASMTPADAPEATGERAESG
jgi:hypothetical protein